MIGAVLGESRGAGAAAFAPTDISGLKLWLKADSLSLSDGDAVASWTDSSGNSNAASQGTAANKPTYKASIINSLPVVRFDGSNDYLTIARNAGLEPTACTIFAVVRASSSPSAFSYIVSKKLSAGSSASYSVGVNAAAGSRGLCNVATSGEKASSAVAQGTVWNSFAHVLCVKIDGSNIHQYFDGNEIGIAAVGAVGAINYDSNNLMLGAYDATQLYWGGDLAELLIYNTALSDANRWSVQGYLGNRWAIA
jgi:hypothetical protein